jgi:hypothetical protein
MIPTIDHYVLSCLKAMRETIIPAIGGADSFALEQAHLVMGILTLIGEHWDKAHQMELAELHANRQLASELLTAVEGDSLTMRAAEVVREAIQSSATMPVDTPTLQKINSLNGEMRRATESLLEACYTDGTGAFQMSALKMVTARSREEADRARIWFSKSRLDPDWASLPPIAVLFEGASSGSSVAPNVVNAD